MREWLWRLLGWPATFNLTEGVDPTFDWPGEDE